MLSNDCWKATLRSLQSGWFYMHLWKDFGFICTTGKICHLLVTHFPSQGTAISPNSIRWAHEFLILIWCKDRKDNSGFIIKAECPCKGMWHLFNLPGTRRTRWCTRGVLIARDNVMVACRHPTFAPPDATAMQFYLSFILVIEMSYFMLLPFTC